MKKTPSLSDLEYFLTVVSNGSLLSASKTLGVQQSTLSVAIQRLESILEKSLLIRSRHGITTTREGQAFAGQARLLVEQWKEISESGSSKSSKSRERFSIGCHQSIGLYTLRRFLPAVLSQSPSLEITIEHNYTHDLVEAVLKQRIDFAFTVNPLHHADLETIDLYPTYVAVWSSENADQLNPDVLFFDPRMYSVETVLAQVEKANFGFLRKLPVASLDTIASLIVSGAGRGILPADTACGQGGPLLKILLEPKLTQPLTVSLAFRKDILFSQSARALKDAIQFGLRDVVPGRKYQRPKHSLLKGRKSSRK